MTKGKKHMKYSKKHIKSAINYWTMLLNESKKSDENEGAEEAEEKQDAITLKDLYDYITKAVDSKKDKEDDEEPVVVKVIVNGQEAVLDDVKITKTNCEFQITLPEQAEEAADGQDEKIYEADEVVTDGLDDLDRQEVERMEMDADDEEDIANEPDEPDEYLEQRAADEEARKKAEKNEELKEPEDDEDFDEEDAATLFYGDRVERDDTPEPF